MNYTEKLCRMFYVYGGGEDFLDNPQHQANCLTLWSAEQIEEEVKKKESNPNDIDVHDDFSDNWYNKYIGEFGDPKQAWED